MAAPSSRRRAGLSTASGWLAICLLRRALFDPVAFDPPGIEAEAETRRRRNLQKAVDHPGRFDKQRLEPVDVFDEIEIGESAARRQAVLGEHMVGYGNVMRTSERSNLAHLRQAADP